MKKKKTRIPGLYRLEDGRFHVRVTATDPRTGQRSARRRTLEHGTSMKEAQAFMAAMREAVQVDPRSVGRARVVQLNDYAERWIERKAERLRPGTVDRYVYALGRHILPRLGRIRLQSIDRTDVEGWVQWAETAVDRSGEAYSRDTVQGWWRVLCAILRDAAADYDLSDPTTRVPGPRIYGRSPKREQRTLTLDEMEGLLGAMLLLSPHRYLEVYTLAWTGMRPGELYALTWDAVDLRRGTLTISESVNRGHVSGTKTGVQRVACVTKHHCRLLEGHRKLQMAARLRIAEELREDQPEPKLELGLVFPSTTGGHRPVSSLQKPMRRAVRHAELDVHVTPQVLRRTFNTLAIRAGIDRIVLRSMMGHVDERMTEKYSGVDAADKIRAIRKLQGET